VLDEPFWDARLRRELTVMRCRECQRAYCPLEGLRVGLPVEVTFEDTGHGWVLPHFRPVPERNP